MKVKTIVDFGLWSEILTSLKPKDNLSMHKLSRILDITYSHFLKIVKELERLNWLKTKKEGREIKIELTPSGVSIKHDLKNVLRKIKKAKEVLE